MNRMASPGFRYDPTRRPSEPGWNALSRSVRNRQLAVQYLGAAGRSVDRHMRELLRRTAAELILPRIVDSAESWRGRASALE
jgi:hypothetical protein